MSVQRPAIHFVDDDPALLRGMSLSMRRRRPDWIIQSDDDPLKALESFAAAPADVVVSDLRMPGLNGIEMLLKMKARRPDAATGFVMLTGTGSYETALKAINDAKIVRFLEKPCETDDLISAIEDTLANSSTALQTAAANAEEAADAVNAAVLILGPDARLIYANAAGRDLLSEADPLTLNEDSICRPRDASNRDAFAALIADCATHQDGRPHWLTLDRSTATGYISMVAKCEAPDGQSPRVTIIASDPERRTILSTDAVRHLFNLSRAEAAIAISIAKGDRLEDAAAASGVTISSARTYLKRVFLKTGAGRQADLVKLVHNSPAALIKR
ncbi:MAG: response regulator, partial [Pseudomonadota bacterium]